MSFTNKEVKKMNYAWWVEKEYERLLAKAIESHKRGEMDTHKLLTVLRVLRMQIIRNDHAHGRC
jgi:hypothetical protein